MNEHTKLTTNEIFNEDPEELKMTAINLQNTLEQLGVQAFSANQPTNHYKSWERKKEKSY